jgi:hypothetical protein
MNFLISIVMTFGLSWAGPQKKVTHGADLENKESYSVAITGIETDTLRIQHLLLKGKNFFMASKLVNGSVFFEKAISVQEYGEAKKIATNLIALPTSDVCTQPITITLTKGSKVIENKVCGEKQEILREITPFNEKVKSFLGKN